jgi:hypothetical protein
MKEKAIKLRVWTVRGEESRKWETGGGVLLHGLKGNKLH